MTLSTTPPALDNKTIFDSVRDVSHASESDIRSGLAKFLFMKESVFQKVGELSGGERLRAALARGFLGAEKPELLILDDGSRDKSVAVGKRILSTAGRNARWIVNLKNSGSVFTQWALAAREAKEEFLWIAEADDGAEPEFLSACARHFGPRVVLVFTDSAQIDENGRALDSSYQSYLKDFGVDFEGNFTMSGKDFAKRYLSVKNVILNVSSVLFRRNSLVEAINRLGNDWFQWKVAGDWRIYFEILNQDGCDVCYIAKSYNIHRRHQKSVTKKSLPKQQVQEIEAMHVLARKHWPDQIDTEHQERVLEAARQELGHQ